MSAHLLVYDIPQNRDVPNPSARLRPIAFRINLSCWVIMRADMPWDLLNHWTENRVKWRIVKFDESESENLAKLAIDSIKVEIRGTLDRANRTLSRETRKLQEGDEELRERLSEHRKATLRTVKKLRRTLRELQSAASRFGVTDRELGLGDAIEQVGVIGYTMRERAREYVNSLNALAALNGPQDGLLQTLRNGGQVPEGLIGDYLEDAGVNVTRYRKLFSGNFFS